MLDVHAADEQQLQQNISQAGIWSVQNCTAQCSEFTSLSIKRWIGSTHALEAAQAQGSG